MNVARFFSNVMYGPLALMLVLSASTGHSTESSPAVEAGTAAIVEHPARAFGYVLGDILIQRIRLSTSDGTFKPAQPLPLGRIGFWLERQETTETTDADNITWLEIRYQIVNAPESVLTDKLPALTLTSSNAKQLQIPASAYSLGPITPANLQALAGWPVMQPDRSPAIPDTRSSIRLLRLAALGLLATVLCWLGWWLWRQRRDRDRLPFAAAWEQIQQLSNADASQHPEAWIALHNALNRYGGKTVQSSTLQELTDEQAWLAPLQPRLDSFFKASAGHFFEHPARKETFPLNELSRDLYVAEKSQAI
ncbi:MAG: hypothetical protein KTR32_04225 [Granulosicoccus sp.]|nr:hypothetical protein [Granulosicoccus sp.]